MLTEGDIYFLTPKIPPVNKAQKVAKTVKKLTLEEESETEELFGLTTSSL